MTDQNIPQPEAGPEGAAKFCIEAEAEAGAAPLDVALDALRRITRTVYAEDTPLDSPSYSALHLQAVGIARDAIARLASISSPREPEHRPIKRIRSRRAEERCLVDDEFWPCNAVQHAEQPRPDPGSDEGGEA